jgi:hypothetical protein
MRITRWIVGLERCWLLGTPASVADTADSAGSEGLVRRALLGDRSAAGNLDAP